MHLYQIDDIVRRSNDVGIVVNVSGEYVQIRWMRGSLVWCKVSTLTRLNENISQKVGDTVTLH